jgi:hypothetical protein
VAAKANSIRRDRPTLGISDRVADEFKAKKREKV